jgi:hypothetical protein
MGLHPPGPGGWVHLGLGNSLDPPVYLLLGEREDTNPCRVISATHVANLVNPGLERANPAADEGA